MEVLLTQPRNMWDGLPESVKVKMEKNYGSRDQAFRMFMTYYADEVNSLLYYANSILEGGGVPQIGIAPFTGDPDGQLIAGLWVNNLALRDDPSQINWHGQNISRWRYAGCILISNGEISTHH